MDNNLKYSVIIPAHNEEQYLRLTLNSLLEQTVLPQEVIVVDDNSSDNTPAIICEFSEKHPIIKPVRRTSANQHLPGSKVVGTFNEGLPLLSKAYDVIVKLDADLILPPDYFQTILRVFQEHPEAGIAGGFAWEQDTHGAWRLNHPMNTDHVRGAFKSYSRACFTKIGGLRTAMGWDTVDELLARYYGFSVITIPELKVKHLRPTGKSYNPRAKRLQGEAMYLMRYGWILAAIASLKMAVKQGKYQTFIHNLQGFAGARKKSLPPIVNQEEGRFIRTYRWKGIRSKLPF
ncbi:glycosyltransferase family 2 protein [Robertkochia flava]|uniref:glycosyltransferase family 2 protein n=1 Tax=Robertkochia flava TaxID=3447986 RepID=UPI001CCD25A7|nr:glycosyltransferase family A protein [Robertkochia marina]